MKDRPDLISFSVDLGEGGERGERERETEGGWGGWVPVAAAAYGG